MYLTPYRMQRKCFLSLYRTNILGWCWKSVFILCILLKCDFRFRRNRHRFLALYEKAETLFKQLADFQDAWRPFVILGCVNLEDLCGIYLKTRDDWDKNFKACKQFSQQIAKIAG